MIDINVFERKEQVIGYEIQGHAGFATRGNDIVCAAVSFLAINTANSIEKFCGVVPSVDIDDDGYLKVIIEDEITDKTKVLLDAFVSGVIDLKRDYSNKPRKLTRFQKFKEKVLNKRDLIEYINITFEEV